MTTMIERMAEALWMSNRPEGAPGYEELSNVDKFQVEMIARDVLKVQREPTDTMMVAVEEAFPDLASFDEKEKSPSYHAWQVMIDAALKEGED